MLSKRKGFTFVEVMIVLSIIGVLSAIAIPNYISYELRKNKKLCLESADWEACQKVGKYYEEDITPDNIKEFLENRRKESLINTASTTKEPACVPCEVKECNQEAICFDGLKGVKIGKDFYLIGKKGSYGKLNPVPCD